MILLWSAAVLGHRSPPLGPMPNEDIDSGQLDSLEKYRSYTRYVTAVEEADRKEVWWRTYRKHREEETEEGKSQGKKDMKKYRQNTHANKNLYVTLSFCFYCVWSAVKPINIGLPYQRPSRKTEVRERKRLMMENKRNPELERADRLRDCEWLHLHHHDLYILSLWKDQWAIYYKKNQIFAAFHHVRNPVKQKSLMSPFLASSSNIRGQSKSRMGEVKRPVPHPEGRWTLRRL